MAKKRLLERIKDEIRDSGLTVRTIASRKWIQDKVRTIRLPGSAKYGFVNLSDKSRSSLGGPSRFIGRMFFYFYDPKTKDKLPYYDIFPLVIPIEPYHDGFLGLNLHYISPKDRISLLDKLEFIMSDNRYDERTRFKISYNFLKKSSNIFEATPCIKRYLYDHVKSSFLEITADEWDIACYLPFSDFKKQSKGTVWTNSRRMF